ncbi:hypothetical protein [Longibaculum muris]
MLWVGMCNNIRHCAEEVVLYMYSCEVSLYAVQINKKVTIHR